MVNGFTAEYSQGSLDGEQMIKMNINVLNNLSQNTHDLTVSAGNELFLIISNNTFKSYSKF